MNQHTLAPTPAAPPQLVFIERIDQLCAEHSANRTTIGTKAGLSKQAVRTWIGKALAGKLQRTQDLHKFAAHYKKSVEWLLGETMLVEVSPDALRLDSKAMADEAVEMLVDIDKIDPREAAALMVGIRLDPPSVKGFYKAARLRHAPRTRADELESPRKPKR